MGAAGTSGYPCGHSSTPARPGLPSRELQFWRELKCAESDSVLWRAVNFYFLPQQSQSRCSSAILREEGGRERQGKREVELLEDSGFRPLAPVLVGGPGSWTRGRTLVLRQCRVGVYGSLRVESPLSRSKVICAFQSRRRGHCGREGAGHVQRLRKGPAACRGLEIPNYSLLPRTPSSRQCLALPPPRVTQLTWNAHPVEDQEK